MKKYLNEVKRLQKIAGILKENVNEAPKYQSQLPSGELYRTLVKSITAEDNILLKSGWEFDKILSANADTKELRSFYKSNVENKYYLTIMHDDYDNTGWSIKFFEDSDAGDRLISDFVYLDQKVAMDTFNKLVGKGDQTMYWSPESGAISYNEIKPQDTVNEAPQNVTPPVKIDDDGEPGICPACREHCTFYPDAEGDLVSDCCGAEMD